jgi:hypothetical protein
VSADLADSPPSASKYPSIRRPETPPTKRARPALGRASGRARDQCFEHPSTVAPAYLDGVGIVCRRGRSKRLRRELSELGLSLSKVVKLDRGFAVTIGASSVARDVQPLADVLHGFDARLTLVEIARDVRIDASADREGQLDEILSGVRLRENPERDWYRPPGLACRYLGPIEEPLNGCAYVRHRSKLESDAAPVAHVELRLRGGELRSRGLSDPHDLEKLEDPRAALALWSACFDAPALLIRARARPGGWYPIPCQRDGQLARGRLTK